jgi:hypothetical protein
MHKRAGIPVGLLLGALVLVGSSAVAEHSTEVTDDEVKCQQGASLGLAKFVKKKWQCIARCERKAREGVIDASECVPPYSGDTANCVTNVAEPKATNLISARCERDCPECYASGDCSAFASTQVGNLEAEVDVLKGLVYCDDSGSPDGLSREEARCQDAVATHLRNFAFKKIRCLRKCRKDEHKGKTTGSCDPVALGDAKATRCVDREETRAAFLIDKKCTAPRGEFAECHANGGLTTGAAWVTLVEQDVDALDPDLFCVDQIQP